MKIIRRKIFFTRLKGMTFMEMMIAISIFTMGIGGFAMLFYNSWKSNSFIMEEGMASTLAVNTVNNISRELRGIRQSEHSDYMIEKADNNELVVYYDIDEDGYTERIRYFVDDDADTFNRGVAEATGDPLEYPADHSSDDEYVLSNYVMNGDLSEPVFRYYDNLNIELAVPTPTDIRLIEVNLWVNIKPLSAPDNVRFGTSVVLRNLDENI